MRPTYRICFDLNVGALLPEVGKVLDSLSDSMSAFGFDEKVSLRGQPLVIEMSAERELHEHEKAAITKIIADGLREKFPGSDPVLQRFQLT